MVYFTFTKIFVIRFKYLLNFLSLLGVLLQTLPDATHKTEKEVKNYVNKLINKNKCVHFKRCFSNCDSKKYCQINKLLKNYLKIL